ncbi:hypothetical protein N7495_001196 [Penicillium taxi]|uniref:uncharacterized protein n=1 Tax=Penicillium taxi TaxID=168475 RepID=UPI002544E814|nr:uncharacterized protein N7495_001196 [Penicillium taxi]KAJ5908514.1 hypothetical protein N7495_001196 [Penicillium taxi]
MDNMEFTKKVEAERDFWSSPGPYLRKSMLVTLARNISGCELPLVYEHNTFDDPDHPDQDADIGSSLTIADDIYNAVVDSTKSVEMMQSSDVDEEDDEEEDSFWYD